MGAFVILVNEGVASGLSKEHAHARARELLPDGEESALTDTNGPPEGERDVEAVWSKLQRTWKKRESVELVDVMDELNDLLERGVINRDQLTDLAERSELIMPTLTSCAKERKAQAKARRDQAAAALASATPETRAATEIQRQLRGWKAREHYAWLLRERARKIREEARQLAKKKKKELEAKLRTQLLDVKKRWGESHATEDLKAIGATIAQAAKLRLKTADVEELIQEEKARRAAVERTQTRAASKVQAHARRIHTMLYVKDARRIRIESEMLAEAQALDAEIAAKEHERALALKAVARERIRKVREEEERAAVAAAAEAERRREEVEKEAMRQRLAAEKAEAAARARARREAEEKANREAEERIRLEREERARRVAEAKARREAEERAKRLELARREALEEERHLAEAEAVRLERERETAAQREAARLEAEKRAQRAAELAAKEAARRADEEAHRLEEQARRRAEEEAEEEARKRAQAALELARKMEAARSAIEARLIVEAEGEDGVDALRDAANEQARREASLAAEREAALSEAAARMREAKEAEAARLEAERKQQQARLEAMRKQFSFVGTALAVAKPAQPQSPELQRSAPQQLQPPSQPLAQAKPVMAVPTPNAQPSLPQSDHVIKTTPSQKEFSSRMVAPTSENAAAAARRTREKQMRQLQERAKADLAAFSSDHAIALSQRQVQVHGVRRPPSMAKAKLEDAKGRDERINSAAWSSQAAAMVSVEKGGMGGLNFSLSFKKLQRKLTDMDEAVEARRRGAGCRLASAGGSAANGILSGNGG